jgi:hypothetical protein
MQPKIRILKLALGVIFWVIFSSFHPFYLSVTEINLNQKEKNAQLSVKCFTNDLENVLRTNLKKKVDLLDQSKFEYNKEILNTYILKNLIINVNKRKLELSIIGYEKEEDAIWIYFETSKFKWTNPNFFEITNTILFDLSPDQLNIIHLIKSENRVSAKIKLPDTKCIFKI